MRTELKAQRLEEHIARILSEAPPLTDEQRIRLAELFRPARELASRKAVVESRIAELDGGDTA